MHIPDGIVPAEILGTTAVVAATGVAYGLKKMENEDVPKTAVLTSFFFVASLIHIPVPPTSVHLLLPGLLGLLLGWGAFPAVFVGLLLQYLFFGYGGITTLGVNVCTMAAPAVVCHYLFGSLVRKSPRHAFRNGFVAGALAVMLSCVGYSTVLFLSGDGFATIALFSLTLHLPVIVIEGIVTGFTLSFLAQVRPESLQLSPMSNIETLKPAS